MAEAKLYKVKLVTGFNAKGRRRAGLELQKGQAVITELNKDQLEALEADVWVEVSDAPEGAEATAPGVAYEEPKTDGDQGGEGDEDEEVEVSTDMSREELESIAKEVGIEDPSQKNYSNKAKLVDAIKAASESEES